MGLMHRLQGKGKDRKKSSSLTHRSLCKKHGHNARGHYKYVNIVVPEAKQPFETQDLVSDNVSWEYSDQFNHDMWDNSQLEVDLTNQSIVTQEPRQQPIGVECVQDEVVQVTNIVNVNDEGADYVRGAQCAQDESNNCVQGAWCAQDESVVCMRGARCAQVESADCMQGARCAQDESAQSSLSKRGRLYKKNLLKDYVCEASMKRSRKF